MTVRIVLLLALYFLNYVCAYAQGEPPTTEFAVDSGLVKGSFAIPKIPEPMPVVLIIAGSGPTDRDGNNPIINKGDKKNNSLKMIADSLAQHGIASFRYDKRGIGESKDAMKDESLVRFDDYVKDASDFISMLRKDKRFSKVIVVGHSEGSLIGMIASSRAKADGFVSVAGAGERADKTIRKQLLNQPGGLADVAFPILDSLVAGKPVEKTPGALAMIFRPSVQPYMISWFKYDPSIEIAKLKIPVLIVQGTTDMQVSVDDAKALAKAQPKASSALIEGMNHILKNADADKAKNFATYSDPSLPLPQKFVDALVDFIAKVK